MTRTLFLLQDTISPHGADAGPVRHDGLVRDSPVRREGDRLRGAIQLEVRDPLFRVVRQEEHVT